MSNNSTRSIFNLITVASVLLLNHLLPFEEVPERFYLKSDEPDAEQFPLKELKQICVRAGADAARLKIPCRI